jgi:hypothetical protein
VKYISPSSKTPEISLKVKEGKEDVTVQARAYRGRPGTEEEMRTMLDGMLKAGILTPSHSPYSSPAFFVPKKDGTLRLVVDYRKMNRILEGDIMMAMVGSRVFTCLDMKAGFWQLRLDENSRQYTAMSTPIGLFEYTSLPMGVSPAPARFQRLVDNMFAGLEFCVRGFIDDWVIFSRTLEEHKEHVRLVMERVPNYGLRLSKAKCSVARKRVELLGHTIDQEGIWIE